MSQPTLHAILRLTESARLLYFSLRGAADIEGRVPNQVELIRGLAIEDFSEHQLTALMNELWRAGLIRPEPSLPTSGRFGDGRGSIEVVDYRSDDPLPDWVEARKTTSGPPARRPALERANRPALGPDAIRRV